VAKVSTFGTNVLRSLAQSHIEVLRNFVVLSRVAYYSFAFTYGYQLSREPFSSALYK
jgi:hypothetical protein